jgi:hypothetical protein
MRVGRLLPSVLAFSLVLLAAQAAVAATITDSFNRPNGPLGPPWMQVGTWAVQANRARFTSSQAYGYATVNLPTSAATVEADITLSPTFRRANAGLTILWRDGANHVFCKIEVTAGRPTGLMAIGRKLGGRVTSLLSYRTKTGFANGVTYHVVCRRSGDAVTLTVSGGNLASPLSVAYKLTSADKAAFGTATRVGLRSRRAADEDDGLSAWDNFVAVG